MGKKGKSPGNGTSDARAEAALEEWLRSTAGVLSQNFRRAVRGNWLLFRRFCAETGRSPLPAAPETVAAFVRKMARTRKPGTVTQYLSSVSVLHRFAGLPNPRDSAAVTRAVQRMRVRRGAPQRQARGLTRDVLNRLLAVPGRGLKLMRDKAIVATAYDTLLRRAELVALRVRDIRWDRDGCATVLVRESKTDRHGVGAAAFLNRDSGLLLRRWLRGAGIRGGRVFRSVGKDRAVGNSLDASQVPRIFKDLALKAGLNAAGLSGHSARVGAVQDMIAHGVCLPAIMQAGRWKSDAMVQRYGRRLLARESGAAQLARRQGR